MAMRDLLRPPAIVVVDMYGAIGPTVRPLEYARLLSRLRTERSVRAVVLNIDSPGGVAAGSELIARAAGRLSGEKPVVAFIGGVGASGAYMVASSSRRIIALPSAIVGAIGVISYRPVVAQLLERIGVRMQVTKAGRLKDMTSPFREQTDEEREKEQHLLDSLYDNFVNDVAESRGLSPERAREAATGEVFLAADALSRGLIDETGDLDDAIDWAVAESGAPRRVRIMRPRRTLRDLLFGRASMALAETLMSELEAAVQSGGYYLYTGLYTGPGR